MGGEVGDRDGEYICEACRKSPDQVARDAVTQKIDGVQYDILEILGAGGMGRVYLAREVAAGRLVALKMMLPGVAADPDAQVKFLREIAVTQSLEHPNIARLLHVGSSGGAFFFTSELCDGGSFATPARGGPMHPQQVVPLILQALDGLEHAHAQGVVHRDLTPSNILLTRDGTVKLADFGLAKAFDQAGLSGLTRTGIAAGKPFYMPYQQVVNFRHAKPAVDVWALAACLYHLLTGVYPRDFSGGKDPWQVVLQTAPVPIQQRRPDVPRLLAEVIDTALQDRPEIGFATAGDLRRALVVRGL